VDVHLTQTPAGGDPSPRARRKGPSVAGAGAGQRQSTVVEETQKALRAALPVPTRQQ
jgi:hypothetical protein